jgi:hypothetical protein
MKPCHPLFVSAAAVAAVLVATPARADVTLVFAENGVPRTLWVTPETVALEDVDGSRFYFDATAQVFRMTRPGATTYQEFGARDVEAMRTMAGMDDAKNMDEEMAKAMAQIEDNLKGLPPEQQAMIREKMHAAAPGGPGSGAPETTYEPMNAEKKIAGYPAKGYRVLEDGEATGEIWTTGLKDLGLTEKDLASVIAMAEFVESLSKDLPFARDSMEPRLFNPKAKGFLGIPVLVVEAAGTEDEARTELQKLVRGPVDPKNVRVPPTFKKESLGVPAASEGPEGK